MTDTDLMLKRRIAWDVLPCHAVRTFMPVLKLVPGSDDVNEKEHDESHNRLDRLAPIADDLREQAHMAAEVVTVAMLRLDQQDGPGQEVVDVVTFQNASVIYAGVCAILAQLVETGTLQFAEPTP